MKLQPPTDAYEFPSLPVKPQCILDEVNAFIDGGCGYKMGAKASPLSTHVDNLVDIDCSGFTRKTLYDCLGQPEAFDFPDGSVAQREWCIANKLKLSDTVNAGNADGVVRIAFLTPERARQWNGDAVERHVMLLPGDGLTAESHGGVGPSRRLWHSLPFARFCEVYVLAPAGE